MDRSTQTASAEARNGCPAGPVGSRKGLPREGKGPVFIWQTERGARRNYNRFGRRLAVANRHLFRNGTDGHGLLQVLPSGKTRLLTKAGQLAPVLVDSLTIKVTKDGKVVAELPAAVHLNALLRSEQFLQHFRPVDHVTRSASYQGDFSLVQPGFNDGGPGRRILYLGPEPQIADSTETIHRFLDVMGFATSADRTNTVAAALTMPQRCLWPGGIPVILVTATKSHAGKSTITEFIRGAVPKADILYEGIDWPMQSQFQRQVQMDPDIGLVLFDNVRLDSAGGRARFIRSAFIESFVTSAEVALACPGAGEAVHLENRFVVVINTNDGALSPDLLNRSLPIHLAPKGDVRDRPSPIGNPKLEFLPQNRDRIEAELRGMVERWKAAGRPLDEAVKHPMTPWARIVGGILQVNGFSDFLANYGTRQVVHDPVREALAILAAARPGKALRPAEWAKLAVEQGLARTLFTAGDRDTEKGRERAIGFVLTRHLEETFEARTETKRWRVRLGGGCRRWVPGKNPHVRYVFSVLGEEQVAVEDGPQG